MVNKQFLNSTERLQIWSAGWNSKSQPTNDTWLILNF